MIRKLRHRLYVNNKLYGRSWIWVIPAYHAENAFCWCKNIPKKLKRIVFLIKVELSPELKRQQVLAGIRKK